jgi:sulfatase maturation enzyme AslB (radical SAM superfamily)
MEIIPIHPVSPTPAPASDIPCELIIKPTEACNFKCTFCSSTDIAEDNAKILDLQYIFDFLTHYPKTNTIIVNGGDPLMVKPSYYWELIEFLDKHDMPATLSFTTNLWAFYKKPSMWTDLFKHPRVGVTTSFNYGDTRKITHSRVFTEQDFWQVSDMFLEHIGYRPDFISVITDENEDTAIDNVLLAKRMGVECKLNYAMASGDQGQPYQLSKIYKIYVQLYHMGLTEWEYNTKQMIRRLREGSTTCPQSRSCDTYIRALNPGGDYYTCGSFGDDRDKPISYEAEIGS